MLINPSYFLCSGNTDCHIDIRFLEQLSIPISDKIFHPWLSKLGSFSAFYSDIRTCAINGQWGLMGINNVPLILMEINGD